MYRLKNGQETFEIVDGPDAGKRFERGRTYDAVPGAEKHRFELAPGPDTAAALIKQMGKKPAEKQTAGPAPDKKTAPAPRPEITPAEKPAETEVSAGKPTGKKGGK